MLGIAHLMISNEKFVDINLMGKFLQICLLSLTGRCILKAYRYAQMNVLSFAIKEEIPSNQ